MGDEARGLVRKVRLWNDGEKDFDYQVDGNRVIIPKGKYIDTARRTAISIRGFYPGKGVQVSLRIEPLPEHGFDNEIAKDADPSKAKVYLCPTCGGEYAVKEDALKCHKRVSKPRGRRPREVVKNDSGSSTGDNT